jgi:hypothetical protein
VKNNNERENTMSEKYIFKRNKKSKKLFNLMFFTSRIARIAEKESIWIEALMSSVYL